MREMKIREVRFIGDIAIIRTMKIAWTMLIKSGSGRKEETNNDVRMKTVKLSLFLAEVMIGNRIGRLETRFILNIVSK